MRAAAVWHEVVGGSEKAKAPNWYDYALRDRRELCVHDGALRVRGADLLVTGLGCTSHAAVRPRRDSAIGRVVPDPTDM